MALCCSFVSFRDFERTRMGQTSATNNCLESKIKTALESE